MNVIKLSSRETRQFWEIPVLYQDEQLVALDKPHGLPLTPEANTPAGQPNLMSLLHAAIAEGKPWTVEGKITFLKQAHFMDPEMSGTLLLARDAETCSRIANQFGSEQPWLEQVLLVEGVPNERQFEVNLPVGPHPVRSDVVRVDRQHGKKSRTRFELMEAFDDVALLRCWPLTLRHHQVRAHLRHAGHPIVGDHLYGGRPLLLSRLKPDYRLKPNRQERPLLAEPHLHGLSLALSHPITGEQLAITAAMPKELNVALKYLRKWGIRRPADTIEHS